MVGLNLDCNGELEVDLEDLVGDCIGWGWAFCKRFADGELKHSWLPIKMLLF